MSPGPRDLPPEQPLPNRYIYTGGSRASLPLETKDSAPLTDEEETEPSRLPTPMEALRRVLSAFRRKP